MHISNNIHLLFFFFFLGHIDGYSLLLIFLEIIHNEHYYEYCKEYKSEKRKKICTTMISYHTNKQKSERSRHANREGFVHSTIRAFTEEDCRRQGGA